MTELSLSAYARHRKAKGLPGTSLGNVQKAIKTGRIKLLPSGKIDPEVADREWEANTDKGKRTASGPVAKLKKGGEAAAQVQAAQKDSSDFQKARSVKEVYSARLTQLEYEKLSGKLVSVDEVADRWTHIISITRTALLGIPSKIRQTLPGVSKADADAIDFLIREALANLSRKQPAEEGEAPDDEPTD